MKTILRISLMIFFLLSGITSLKSQYVVQGTDELMAKIRIHEGADGIKPLMYSNVKGNPFIFKNFRDAVITATSGEKYKVEVRYDMYAGEMHFREKEKIFSIVHKDKIQTIQTDSVSFIYSAFLKSPDKPAVDGSFFIVLTEGKCKLLVKKNFRLQDPEPPKLYQDAKPAEFVELNDSFYVKKGDGAAVLVKGNTDLLSVMEDQKAKIGNFLKSNRTNFRKAEDLKKVVDFYNNL